MEARMNKAVATLGVSFMLIAFPASVLAGAVARSSTGASTETSTAASTTASVGSCAGDAISGKSSGSTTESTLVSGCSVAPPNVDDDGDGMPSTWEKTYGLGAYDRLDKLLDFDNDFISNYVEYLRKLSPNSNDTDGDRILDGDDFAPTNPEQGALSTEGNYLGSMVTDDAVPR
jgi:hypothetical protein